MPKLKEKLPLFGLMAAFALFFLILFPGACLARNLNEDCSSVFCGNLSISYPFHLKTQPRNCGSHLIELECENNNRTTLVMKNGKFFVQEIFYENNEMRIVDASLDWDDCNSLPLSSVDSHRYCGIPLHFSCFYEARSNQTITYLVNCTKPTKSSLYVDASRCATKSNSSSPPSSYFYFLDGNTQPSDFDPSCTVVAKVPITADNISGMSTLDIYKKLSKGISLSWPYYYYSHSNKISFQDVNLNEDCGSVFCGNLNISYPFRLKTQPRNCGNHLIELECENNNRTTLVMKNGKFSVQEIFYQKEAMRVVDASLDWDDCNSLPLSSVDSHAYFYAACETPHSLTHFFGVGIDQTTTYLVNCTKPMKSSVYADASRCTTKSVSSSRPSSYFYFLDGNTQPSDFNQSCTVVAEVPITADNISGMSTLDIYMKLSNGIWVSWGSCGCIWDKISFKAVLHNLEYGLSRYWASFANFFLDRQSYYDNSRTCILCLGITGGVILTRTLIGIFCLLALVIYKWRRRHLSMDDTIEEFLQSQNNLVPIRYSFREIKKMTKGFKDKLGEGGYGSVFKGKLRSGHYVAIKLLGKSKANGQDFINEVASIGRIHHVNVTKLIGFCVEGSKQALVYDFMVNGSLDKIIFTEEDKNTLGWKKMFDIVLGVARGIDYLHQGCDMQILHFDIKPHNILLDKNFNPKVSDFGLAKLYSVDDSIVSLTAARGTIGYIAPELVYKNIGGISYKADVYSFGMLLLEMIGKRKNLNAFADHTSQIYFPSWIYDQLDQGEDIELGDITDAEKLMVKKMLVVAFWCIQMMPTDRPSMSKVLKVLESDDELLEMPPKPFHQLPLETSTEVHGYEDELTN